MSSLTDTVIKTKVTERKNVINWHEYFMKIADVASERSKDPNTQVGACVVDKNNRIISTGYNGFPNRCRNDIFPWDRDNPDPLKNKYLYVVHAELNAILAAKQDLTDCRIYVNMLPCNECAKAIIQSGIREVIFSSEKYIETPSCQASLKMFKFSGVNLCILKDGGRLQMYI